MLIQVHLPHYNASISRAGLVTLSSPESWQSNSPFFTARVKTSDCLLYDSCRTFPTRIPYFFHIVISLFPLAPCGLSYFGKKKSRKKPSFDHPVLSSSLPWQNLATPLSNPWGSSLSLALLPSADAHTQSSPFKATPAACARSGPAHQGPAHAAGWLLLGNLLPSALLWIPPPLESSSIPINAVNTSVLMIPNWYIQSPLLSRIWTS